MTGGTIRLHHVPQARSFRVLWFLHEAGLPHEVVRQSFGGRALRDPDFLAISPAGRVPAVEFDGRRMFESGAILEYLGETRAPFLTRPPGHPLRAELLEWLHYGETVGQHLAQLTQQHIVLREDWMRSPTVMKLEALRLSRALAGAAQVAAGGWLLPDGFSIADIAVGYGLVLGARFVDLGAIPGATAYRDRLTARPGFRAAEAADGPAELYLQDFYPVPDA
ncbi:MAG: glutathione S-transferase family protein, partial [Gemmobacter sp.]